MAGNTTGRTRARGERWGPAVGVLVIVASTIAAIAVTSSGAPSSAQSAQSPTAAASSTAAANHLSPIALAANDSPDPAPPAISPIPPMPAVAPRPARPTRYVALGDSYSSGVGSGQYSGGSCDRSSNAFPALWAAAHPDASFVFVACAAATVASVTSTQLSALDTSTTMVTITVGGNDVGFESVLLSCVLEGTSACDSAVSAGEAKARTSLQPQLVTLYRAITARAHGARVLAVGYPDFYDLSSTRTCLGLGSSSRATIDEGIDVLDEVIAAAARTAGVSFVDPRRAFAGHEICDGSAWLHSLDLTDPGASYHPTDSGQAAYLAALVGAV